MDILRTPDAAFDNLPDYTFAPNYVEVDDTDGGMLRLHYVDEGPRDAPVILCMHGEPSWSFLYRKMIPVFVAAGYRVVAPDLAGFGKSDKPTPRSEYTYARHVAWMSAWLEAVDLTGVTLVCQDWGGVLGLTIPMDMPERFDRLLVMNTTIPVGVSPGEGFDAWRAYNRTQPDMDIAALIKRGTPVLDAAEAAAYAAPFPDVTYKAGVRRFPELVMTDPGMEGVETSKRAAN